MVLLTRVFGRHIISILHEGLKLWTNKLNLFWGTNQPLEKGWWQARIQDMVTSSYIYIYIHVYKRMYIYIHIIIHIIYIYPIVSHDTPWYPMISGSPKFFSFISGSGRRRGPWRSWDLPPRTARWISFGIFNQVESTVGGYTMICQILGGHQSGFFMSPLQGIPWWWDERMFWKELV